MQQIALHKLHCNLANFCIDEQSINELSDVIFVAYENTADSGDILKGNCDDLRLLVMTYVADRSDALLKFASFRNMQGDGGRYTSDFMALKYTT